MSGCRRREGSIIKRCHGDGRIDGKDDLLHALQEVHQRGATACVCCVEVQNACRFSFLEMPKMFLYPTHNAVQFQFYTSAHNTEESFFTFFTEEFMYTSENDVL